MSLYPWRAVLDELTRNVLLLRQGGAAMGGKSAAALAESAQMVIDSAEWGDDCPLWELRDTFGLDALQTFVVAVAMGAATYPKFAYGCALLRQNPDLQVPNVAVVVELLEAEYTTDGGAFGPLRPGSPLVDLVLVDTPPAGVQGLGDSFSLAARVLDWWRGHRRIPQSLSAFCHLVDRVGAPEPILDAAGLDAWARVRREHAAARRLGTKVAAVLTGPDGCGKTLLAEHLAMADGRPLLVFDVKRLRGVVGHEGAWPANMDPVIRTLREVLREARLRGAFLYVRGISAWPESLDAAFRDLVGAYAPRCALGSAAPFLGRTLLPADMSPVTLGVVRPQAPERKQMWTRFLGNSADDGVLSICTHRYLLTGDQIATAAEQIRTTAQLRGVEAVTVGLMDEVVRRFIAHTLDSVARHVVHTEGWNDLVVTNETRLLLRVMAANHRHRQRVFDEWGFARRFGRGLGMSALFSGPPGTGKTMAAGVLARELGLPLFQVELSQLVSKWVGETEKNLDVVFSQAEAAGAVLLFDEADSLFARRTEVASANDRYANLEVNHLLQRMEAFQGIVMLTTNNAGAIDQAFHRRFTYRLDFPLPDARQREDIWRKLVPQEAPVRGPIDFAKLAAEFELSGGHIKNAILRAAFFAAELDQDLSEPLLRMVAALELKQMGAVVRGVDLETVWAQLQTANVRSELGKQ